MKRRTRIKICGITELPHALQVADLGGDAIGLVFHSRSPRVIDIETAVKIRRAMPPFLTVTALLMNEEPEWVAQVIETVKPDCLQFHGEESLEFCNRWSLPFIKAIPMPSVNNATTYAGQYPGAQGFLLDSNVAGGQGGSGDSFDWSKIPSPVDFPLMLAGGLNPGNVAAAIRQVQPWAVDVSSGVEKSRGVKDADLIEHFFREVKSVDCIA